VPCIYSNWRPLRWDRVGASHSERSCTLVYLGRGHLWPAEVVADTEIVAPGK
jgi:hypothetical protein